MRDTLLFDLDGTLTDTDALHYEAYVQLLAPAGKSVTHAEFKARIMGATNDSIMGWLFPDADAAGRLELAERKEAIFRSLTGAMKRTEGLSELLEWADACGLKTAVVTNAPRANAELMLERLGLGARFETLVIGDELARGKPDPLPYATALDRLGSRADGALAFEDSRAGVAAAHAAGIDTVGLTTGLDAAALESAGAVGAVPHFAHPWLIARLASDFGSAPRTT
ncbi:MAG: HAD-IA family hydrolase [Alphaproteobacteria bacterium]|nr:HAD-IA family hydrolase [Alphaproteobacteria bacterium]